MPRNTSTTAGPKARIERTERKNYNLPMKLHQTPESHTSASATAATLPTHEFAEITARKLECHIRNGNWDIARRVLDHAANEFQASLLAASRTPEQWLDAHLCELPIPTRIANHLIEGAGCNTLRDALTFINSGEYLENFGPVCAEIVWAVAEEKGVNFPRSKLATTAALKQRYVDQVARRKKIAANCEKKKSQRTPAEIAKDRADWGSGKKAAEWPTTNRGQTS